MTATPTGPSGTPLRLWPRIEGSIAALPLHTSMITRSVRGDEWRILRNEANGTHVRVNAALWMLVERFDGQRTIAAHLAALEITGACVVDEALQEQMAAGLATLERAGVLQFAGKPNTLEPEASLRRLQRHKADRRAQRRARWRNPMLMRWPLHDPDRWLDRLRPVWQRGSLRTLSLALFLVLTCAAGVMLTQADELYAAFESFVSTPSRWWALVFVWPLLKGMHEAAHAVAVRRAGGRVHEVGIALLVLMPMPYVDASDASLFVRKRQRVLVGAAGVLVELFIAAIALLAWGIVEPGVLRETCFAIALAGSVSSLLLNANPLLRFDGYFVLQDLIDMPNLAPRANAWWLGLARRLLGLAPTTVAVRARAETGWLAGYGLAAFAYRYVVVVAIAWWLMQRVPIIGTALAIMALWPLLVRPVVRLLAWLHSAPELHGRRSRVATVCGAGAAVLMAGLLWFPLPASTRVEGIVSVPGHARIVAPEAGEIVSVAASSDARVRPGQPLVGMRSPALEDELARVNSQMETLQSQRAAALQRDPLEARLLADDLRGARRRLADLEARLASMRLSAAQPGRFVASPEHALVGRFAQRGDTLGHLIGAEPLLVRAVLREEDIGRLRDGVSTIDIRLAEAPHAVVAATLLRELPAGDRELPSAALARSDGSTAPAGRHAGIAVASVGERMQTVEPVFHVELGLPADAVTVGIGGRAYVTFRHPDESLLRRWWRGTRQLFLERLAV